MKEVMMTKVDYVCGFIFCNNHVLLLKKNRPDWQAGKLNGIGGKIEKDELPIDAMEREFKEEVLDPTGLDISIHPWHLFCTWDYGNGNVYFYKTYTHDFSFSKLDGLANDVNEEFEIFDLEFEGFLHYENILIKNLYWLIPLALNGKAKEIVNVKEVEHDNCSNINLQA